MHCRVNQNNVSDTSRPWRAALAAGLGILLTVYFSHTAWQWEQERRQLRFEGEAQSWFHALRNELRQNLASIEHLGELIRRSPDLHPENFRELARPFIRSHPQIEALAWAPRQGDAAEFRVAAAEPAVYEQVLLAARSGGPGGGTLERALAQQATAASERLVSLKAEPSGAGFLLIRPLYPLGREHHRAQAILIGSYGVSGLVHALAPLPGGVDSHIFDVTAAPTLLHSSLVRGGRRGVFASDLSVEGLVQGVHFSQFVEVGGRHWQVILTPGEALEGGGGMDSLAVALFGVSLSVLAGLYMLRPARAAGVADPPDEPGCRSAHSEDLALQHDRFERLRCSESHFRALVEDAPDLLAQTDAEGRILYVSPSCRDILGYEPEELMGRYARELLHPDDVFRGQRGLRSAAGRPGLYSSNFRVRRADGGYAWLDGLSRVVADPQTGGAGDTLTIARDGSWREHEVQTLRQREVLYRSVFDTAQQPIALASADGQKLLRVNQAFCAMLGYSKAELRDLDVSAITHPADRGSDASLAARVAASELAPFSFQKRYLRKDGTTVWAILHVAVVAQADGRPHYVICHIYDETARRLGQAEFGGMET
jgi:PAS domain S-box-containing protein